MRTHVFALAFALAILLVVGPLPAPAAPRDGSSWEPLGLSGGGGMFGPAISPVDGQRMMVHCDMSGAYVSEDGGRNWSMIHHRELISNTQCRPAFHPTKAEVVYSATGWNGHRLMVSKDGGFHWELLAELPGPLRGPIAIDPGAPSSLLVGVGEEVYRSHDGGRHWDRCRGPHGEAVGFHFDQTTVEARRRCFAATKKGIWRSTDGGRTWSVATAGLPSTPILAFAGGSHVRGRKKTVLLYCAVPSRVEGDGITGGIYRSTDAGTSWEPVEGMGLNRDTRAVDRWATGNVAQYHWILTTDVDPRRVYAFNSNTGIPQPHHATVYRSDDAGKTWRATFNPDPRWEPTNVEKTYVIAEDNQFYQGVPFGMAIDGSDPDHIFFVTGKGFVTENGGKSWFCAHTRLAKGQKKPVGNRRAPGLDWVCNGLVVTSTWNYYQDPFRPKFHYICYTDIGFARSEDAGATWKWWSEEGRAPWRNTCYELALDPDVKGRMWGAFSNVHDIPNGNIIMDRHRAEGPGGVCVSTDFGRTWQVASTDLPGAPATSIVLDPSSRKRARTLYVGVFDHGVFRSTDGGTTWESRSEGLGSDANRRVCRVHLHPDGTLFALVTARRRDGRFQPDGVGLYRSRDGGGRWECVTTGEGFLWPKDVTVDPDDSDTIYLGNCDANRDGRGGLWRTTNGGRTWKRLAREGSQHFGAYLHPRHEGWIYMTLTEGAPGAGLWLSKDGGRSFRALEGLPFRNVQRVHFPPGDANRIYVTTFGGSVWRGPEE